MRDFLLKRPMLLSAICGSAVSVIGIYTEKVLLCFCALILVLFFFMVYKRIKTELLFAVSIIFVVAISTVFAANSAQTMKKFDQNTCSGRFVVADEPVNHGDYYTSTFEVLNSDTLKSGTKIAVTYYEGEIKFSKIIEAQITLKSMDDSKYKYSYYSQNIFLKGIAREIKITGETEMVLDGLGKVRNYIKGNILKYYGKQESATMLALLTGDKSHFTNRFYSNVKASGVAHVMVVSGMHLSVIVSLFLYAVKRFVYNRYLKALTVVLVTLGVMFVCGFTMSIIRAGITYLFLALSLLLNRESTPENTLGSAVCTILLLNPFAIMNIAFELSVLSTFAILVVALPVCEFICEKGIVKSGILTATVSSCIISISALIFTAPVTIYVFGYISNVSVVTNLLISLAVTVAIYLCIIGFLVPFLKPIIFGMSTIVVRYINSVINYFGSLPFATTNLSKFAAVFAGILIIALLWILVACKNRKDMLKLEEIRLKKYNEGGGKIKWQS